MGSQMSLPKRAPPKLQEISSSETLLDPSRRDELRRCRQDSPMLLVFPLPGICINTGANPRSAFSSSQELACPPRRDEGSARTGGLDRGSVPPSFQQSGTRHVGEHLWKLRADVFQRRCALQASQSSGQFVEAARAVQQLDQSPDHDIQLTRRMV